VLKLLAGFPNRNLRINVMRMRGYAFREMGQIDSAYYWQCELRDLSRQIRDTANYLRTVHEVAGIQMMRNNYKAALKTLWTLDSIPETKKPPFFQVRYYDLLGQLYNALDQPENAIAQLRTSLSISEKHKLNALRSSTMRNMARPLLKTGDTLGAIDILKRSLRLNLELNNIASSGHGSRTLADIYLQMDSLVAAESYASDALHYFRKGKVARGESFALKTLAMIKLRKEMYDDAIGLLEQADSVAVGTGNWENRRDIHTLLSEAHEALGNFEQALAHQKQVIIAADSVEFLESKKYADSLALALQAGRKPDPNTNDSESQSENSTSLLPLLLILLALAAIIGLVLFLRTSRRKPQLPPQTPPVAEPSAEATGKALTALRENKDWGSFMLQFDAIYPQLLHRIAAQYSDLTPTDMRIIATVR
ncbi:MAG: hypothetical protein AAF570_25845, partial [Bacteroidota bacterium]